MLAKQNINTIRHYLSSKETTRPNALMHTIIKVLCSEVSEQGFFFVKTASCASSSCISLIKNEERITQLHKSLVPLFFLKAFFFPFF